jgi:hypothetical protein
VAQTRRRSAPTPELVFHDARSILREKLNHPQDDVPQLVSPGTITVLGGYTGDGKTPLTVHMLATALNGGGDFIGIDLPPLPDDYKVVYLTQESAYTFKPLLEAAGLSRNLKEGRLEVVYLHEALTTVGTDWPEIVEQASVRIGPRGLLVVDPLGDWAMVRNEDDNAVMHEAFRPLIAGVGGSRAAWVIAHAWKSFASVPDEEADVQHIRAAGAIVSNATRIVLYKKTKPLVGPSMRYFKVARSRFGDELEPRYVELKDGKLRRISDLAHGLRKVGSAESRLFDALAAAHPEPVLYKDLRHILGIPTSEIPQLVEGLLEAKRIRAAGERRSKTEPYRLYLSEVGT